MDSVSTLLEQLNPAQRAAVTTVAGPVLVVAGAGSGKTRVITYRIPYLLFTGVAAPENILALTFTNKAAGEMKARASQLAGNHYRIPLISTFHSFCAVLLRRHISLLGYSRDFQIFDEEDQLSLLKECISDLQKENRYSGRDAQNFLKWQKNRAEPAEIYDPNLQVIFDLYARKLRANNGVDFDDLLSLPIRLFREQPDLQRRYCALYRFIMVDEYQDTNEVQYELLKLLAGEDQNVLVVGDEDQSIYKFRGARSENIQHFLKDFRKVKVVKLEQNYRSTKTIIKAAHEVISRNSRRIKKELWTDNQAGEPIEIYHALDEYDEATYVTLKTMALLKDVLPSSIAVLYRANAQSRVFEESFGKAQIPHRIVGSVGFYERREIKDVIAFVRLLVNKNDAFSFLRVVNVPPRGAGKKLLERIQQEAEANNISTWDAAANAGNRNVLSFLELYNGYEPPPSSFLEKLLKQIGYFEYLRKEDSQTADDRIENCNEFLGYLREQEALPEFDLATFLSELPLQSRSETPGEAVTLLTVHSAKGLEFRVLFVVGLEEGVFPHIRSLESSEDLEEERRLFYVAMTRAKEKLLLSWSQRRSLFGSNATSHPSRFLDEIPSWFKVIRQSERFMKAPETESKSEFRTGSIVSHEKFGRGTVLQVQGVPQDWKLKIRFQDGVRTIMTRFARITLIR
ncbi:UvrD-helicase domain-containing protein [bacterium]|nr:UvrD-helicase domain-containing protein [bacterium]MCI0605121.1 UvrD-helicase domain-containing protein [bacterium]